MGELSLSKPMETDPEGPPDEAPQYNYKPNSSILRIQ